MKKYASVILLFAVILVGCQKENGGHASEKETSITDVPVPELMYRTGGRHLISIDYEREAYDPELKIRSLKTIVSIVEGLKNTDDINFNPYAKTDMKAITGSADDTCVTAIPVGTILTEFLKLSTTQTFSSTGIHHYTFTYKTVNGKGEPAIASAVLMLPKKSVSLDGNIPIIVFPYYARINRPYSPSLCVQQGLDYGVKGIAEILNTTTLINEFMARCGYAVLLPDGLAMGANYDLHNMCTKTGAYCIADALLAAKEIEPGCTDAAWDENSVYMIGLSEGAYLAMESSKIIQEEYSDVFTIKGTACIDGPYDIAETMANTIFNEPKQYADNDITVYIPTLMFSLSDTYSAAQPFFHYTNAFRNDIEGVENLPQKIFEFMTDPANENAFSDVEPYISSLIGEDYTNILCALNQEYVDTLLDPESFAHKFLVNCNSFDGWMPRMPLMMFQCPADDLIPSVCAAKALDAFNNAGSITADITYFNDILDIGDTHVGACVSGLYKAFKWVDKLEYGDRLLNSN